MTDLPSPCITGSPTRSRRSSQPVSTASPDLISPLQSPQAFASFQRPTPTRSASSSDDRLSKLFPSRRPSSGGRPPSISEERKPRPPSKQFSLPGSLVPAVQPAYTIPSAPAPPAFAVSQPPAPPAFPDHTSYDRTVDPFETQHAPIAQSKPSRTKSVLDRFASLRATSMFRSAKYATLDDIDGDSRDRTQRELPHVAEEDEGLGIDISGLEGPIALQSIHRGRPANVSDQLDADEDAMYAGHAAEFERLEAHDRALGLGMANVVEAAFETSTTSKVTPSQGMTIIHKRELSNQNVAAQDAAEKTGEILAVPETPAFDISTFGGGDIGTSDPLSVNAESRDVSDKPMSYFFPEDKEMPDWRPVSMRWFYVGLLVLLAFTLAGLQEYLCQLSIKKKKEGGGILAFKEANELSVLAYFTWKYAPTIVLLSYGILWQITDYEIKRLEPYYQLSKRTGATAAESLNIDYISLISYFVPFQAVRHGHWAVVISSMGYLSAGSIVPILQSASVNIYPDKAHRKENEFKYVLIDPGWSRAVSAVLVFAAILGIALLVSIRRKSGLLSDPKGIAGIAAMATRSHILNDFRGLDTASQNTINKQLRHRRYILHKSALWQGEYIRNSAHTIREHHTDSRPIMLTKRAGYPFVGSIVVVAILIPIFMFIPSANVLTEKVPFLLTAIATGIKLIWGSLDMSMRLMEPWVILSMRGAPASTLTLDYTGTIPGYLSLKALVNKHYLVSLVGIGAILTEILTVCASSFSVDGLKFIAGQDGGLGSSSGDPPDMLRLRDEDDVDDGVSRSNSGETFKSFWVSFGLSITILIYLTIVAILCLVRRSKKIMPRTPGPIASTLAFIHQSKMLNVFVGAERFDSVRMTKWLEGKGGRYGLGWFNGRDSEDHCGVDEEPLLASYEWGKDWTKGRLVGGEVGGWEHF
ncbi:hypothetical protein EJ05DRAFT_265236 [Pseudovirgaria hyperparasitica]|uniref:Uncharacterized protein n=1 Tax=Pseudovirgaria hyperparasitica TaxID=470096 RepID=A0A6A6WII2_9PEZI|nr:uncharacterized protein EJ05DRAFT_265236 [Pseudovirgaria hyperparasitica]KAF2761477.1 hypothetical protein EJ05DRAFT_265236 [Pseudovirgaria hyperparasitica]